MDYKEKEIKIKLRYIESYADEENGTYFGGVEEPRYIDELKIDVYEDADFDFDKEEFILNGKSVVELGGSNRALEEFGKYLINLSRYETKDSQYHDHFDDINNSKSSPCINLIVRKSE